MRVTQVILGVVTVAVIITFYGFVLWVVRQIELRYEEKRIRENEVSRDAFVKTDTKHTTMIRVGTDAGGSSIVGAGGIGGGGGGGCQVIWHVGGLTNTQPKETT